VERFDLKKESERKSERESLAVSTMSTSGDETKDGLDQRTAHVLTFLKFVRMHSLQNVCEHGMTETGACRNSQQIGQRI
jgi:hypothetical protein